MAHIILYLPVVFILLASCKHLPHAHGLAPCRDTPDEYAKAQSDLARIYREDQEDRDGFLEFDANSLLQMVERDLQRRSKVAELFAKGCLKSPDDYKRSALIFQHGNIPEHFYQAFVWARTALRMGDESARYLMSLTTDRFLVNSGYKQLFGSQAMKPNDSACWCLYPVESSFTDEDRLAQKAKSLAEQIEWLIALNHRDDCREWECKMDLKSLSKSDFVEFW